MVFDFSNYCCFLDPVPFLFPFLDCCLQEIRAVFRFQLFASALRFAVFLGGEEGGGIALLYFRTLTECHSQNGWKSSQQNYSINNKDK